MAATTFTLDNGCLSGDKIRVSVPVSAWDYSFYNSSSNSQRRARGQETKSEAERERERQGILRIRNENSQLCLKVKLKLFCPVLKYTHQTVTVILLHCYTALQFGLIKSFIFSIISPISPLTAISELQVLKLSQARAQCSSHAGQRRRKGEREREQWQQ